MNTVTILDRDELKKLSTPQLNKRLQETRKEAGLLEALLNSTATRMTDGDVERRYQRIVQLRGYEGDMVDERGCREGPVATQ